MRLDDRLRQLGMSQREFARCLGVSEATVSGWISGRNIPDVRKLPLIEAQTGGAVKLADFLGAASEGPGRHASPHGRKRDPAASVTPEAPKGSADARQSLMTEAAELGLDPDAIAAKSIQDAVRAEKTRRWKDENREAMDALNEWTERNGLPLAKYRMF